LILGPGIHEITIRKVGYGKEVVHAEVHSEQQSTIDVALKAAAAELYLTVDVAGALVTLDNEPMGKTPLKAPLNLPPGMHRLSISKPGYRSEIQDVNVVPGDKTALTVTLEKKRVSPTKPAVAPKRPRRSPLFWAALSGTTAGAILGGVFWGLAVNKAAAVKDYNSDYLDAETKDMINFYDKARRAARDDGKNFEKAAVGLTISAGLFAAATVGILVWDIQRHSETEQSISLRPGMLTLRF
jgi:hypothetical protein